MTETSTLYFLIVNQVLQFAAYDAQVPTQPRLHVIVVEEGIKKRPVFHYVLYYVQSVEALGGANQNVLAWERV